MNTEEESLSGVRKAALLVLSLGENAASDVLRNLSPDEVEQIGEEIAQLGNVERESADDVLSEFVALGTSNPLRGGASVAQRFVEITLGPDGSRRFLDRVTQGGKKSHHLDGFGEIDPEHLAKFVQHEHPQTIALVVAHLEPSQGAAVFSLLPDALRSEVSVRVASMEEISPDILHRIGSVLDEKLRAFGNFRRETYGGVRAVAELLNRVDRNTSRDVLENLEENNPDVALSIRNLMFVFDDLLLLDDKAIREVLQQVDKKALAIALKGTTVELQDAFFKNMSQRAGDNLREEMDMMGPIKVKDVEDSQKEVVELVRKLESEGTVSIGSGADEYVI